MSVFTDYIQTLGIDDAWAMDEASGSLAPLTGGTTLSGIGTGVTVGQAGSALADNPDGRHVAFDGTAGADIDVPSGGYPASTPYTFIAIIRYTDVSTVRYAGSIGQNNTSINYSGIRLETNGTIAASTRASLTGQSQTASTYNDGEWHLVIAEFASDASRTITVDTETAATNTDSLNFTDNICRIGSIARNTPSNEFLGDMAFFAITGGVLTASQKQNLYNRFKARYATTATPRSGRYAAGWTFPKSQAPAKEARIIVTQGGTEIQNDDRGYRDNYENVDNATEIINWFTFDVTAGDDLSVTAFADDGTDGDVNSLVVYTPDARSGVVRQWGQGQHAGPQFALIQGAVEEIGVEVGTCDRYLTRDGAPVGKLFGGVVFGDREAHDSYHAASAILPIASGRLALMTDHLRRIYGVYSTTAAGLTSATEFTVSPSSKPATYLQAAIDQANDIVYLTSRVRASVSGDYFGRMYRLSGVDTAPSVDEDVIGNGRYYPRMTHYDADNGLVLWAFQERTSLWAEVIAGVYDPAANQHYGINGVAVGGTSDGTEGTPRATTELTTAPASGTAGLQVVQGLASTEFYVPHVLMRVTAWGGTKTAEALGVAIDSEGASDATATNGQVRLFYSFNNTQILTADAGDVFELDGMTSYRATVLQQWRNSDPSTGIVDIRIGVDGPGAAQSTDDYFDFGTDLTVHHYQVDLNGVTDASGLAAAITKLGSTNISPAPNPRATRLQSVYGRPGEILIDNSINEADQTGRQGELYQLSSGGGGAGVLGSSGGLARAFVLGVFSRNH